MVDIYEVMWQRDISGDCPDEDNGSTTLTDGSTSYTITGLEEYSNYIITVIATNAYDMATSNNVTGFTRQSGIIMSLLEFVKLVDMYLIYFAHFYQLHLLLQHL